MIALIAISLFVAAITGAIFVWAEYKMQNATNPIERNRYEIFSYTARCINLGAVICSVAFIAMAAFT